jgi:conjugative relaxase-like TrwC/TraI family protein
VLSIGKLATGQAKYYLDQAEMRVDAVDSVADGLEDYYLDDGEARGRWLGIGARELGLEGVVDGLALRRVLDGLDPWNGAPLPASRSPVRVSGFDLTFSAPKSVSVVYVLGGCEVQDAVRRAHDRAVVEAVGYLERTSPLVGLDAESRVTPVTA